MDSELILIVEDEKEIAELLKEVLKRAGYSKIAVYTDPVVALNRVTSSAPPALVISNYHMHGMKGVKLLDNIRARYPDVQGIIISADTMTEGFNSRDYPVLDKGETAFNKLLIRQVDAIMKKTRV